jgi:hypothetical protein
VEGHTYHFSLFYGLLVMYRRKINYTTKFLGDLLGKGKVVPVLN